MASNKEYLFITLSEDFGGGLSKVFDTKQKAQDFIDRQDMINYIRIKTAWPLQDGEPCSKVYVTTCENPYGLAAKFKVGVFATYSEADEYGAKCGHETNLAHGIGLFDVE